MSLSDMRCIAITSKFRRCKNSGAPLLCQRHRTRIYGIKVLAALAFVGGLLSGLHSLYKWSIGATVEQQVSDLRMSITALETTIFASDRSRSTELFDPDIWVAIRNGDLQKADEMLASRAGINSARRGTYLAARSQVALTRFDFVSAKKYLIEATRIEPKNAHHLMTLATVLSLIGDHDGAAKALDLIIKLPAAESNSTRAIARAMLAFEHYPLTTWARWRDRVGTCSPTEGGKISCVKSDPMAESEPMLSTLELAEAELLNFAKDDSEVLLNQFKVYKSLVALHDIRNEQAKASDYQMKSEMVFESLLQSDSRDRALQAAIQLLGVDILSDDFRIRAHLSELLRLTDTITNESLSADVPWLAESATRRALYRSRVYLFLGVLLDRNGKGQEAFRALELALAEWDNIPEPHLSLGEIERPTILLALLRVSSRYHIRGDRRVFLIVRLMVALLVAPDGDFKVKLGREACLRVPFVCLEANSSFALGKYFGVYLAKIRSQ